jgi:hypothetical protein
MEEISIALSLFDPMNFGFSKIVWIIFKNALTYS